MALDRRQKLLVKLAVDVLREALDRVCIVAGGTNEVRLSLHALRQHCLEPWPLTMCWGAAGQDHVIGCEQGMSAAYNGILR